MVHVVDVVQRRERQREGLVLLEEVVQVRPRIPFLWMAHGTVTLVWTYQLAC